MGVLAKPIPFGDYFLLEKINTGGMAEVYKAKTFGVEGFERIVAVKKILPTIAEDSEFIKMFVDEAKIAVQLTHANIAQIFDLGCIDGQYYIAMEYVPGRDLRVIYDRCVRTGEKLDIACVCYIVSKLCEGLEYAHNKKDANNEPLGIVHRDISPQNVLISYEGECKLIDFGIAKAANKSSATQVGILKGKFSYMSPEQVSGKAIDRRSDIFALGIVLFEMLTLKRLFLGSSDFSTLEKIRKVEVSPPTLYNPEIPEDLEDIVMKALQKDVSERYQTAAELQEDLQRFMFNHQMYYTAKDLSEFCRKLFAQEIALEQKKTEFYKELTKDVLEASRQPVASEDDTSFYDRQNVPKMSGVQYDVIQQSAPKQAIYDELDDFQPPSDDIVYSSKGNSGGRANSVDELGLPKNESLTDLASKQIKIGNKGMPAPRKSMSMLAPVANNPNQKETVLSNNSLSDRASGSSKTHTALIAVVVLLVVIIMALCVIFVVFKYDPYDGVANINIEPAGIVISLEVDGEEMTMANNAPVKSGNLPLQNLSRKHSPTYRIKAKGYEDAEGEIVVLDTVHTTNVVLKPKAGSLNIGLNVDGATVMVDNKLYEGERDFEIVGLDSGEHYIEITKDGYKPIKTSIRVVQGDNDRKIYTLSPMYAGLTIDSSPEEAIFTVRNMKTGEVRHMKSGETFEKFPIDDTYQITYRDGNESRTSTWSPNPNGGIEKRMFEVRPAAAEPAPAPTTASSGSSVGKASKSPAPSKTESKPAKVSDSSESAKKAEKPVAAEKPASSPLDVSIPGQFKITSKPPCEVFINGKSYGMTPKKVELPAGSYQIHFVNAEAGIDSTQTETLKPGEDKKISRN